MKISTLLSASAAIAASAVMATSDASATEYVELDYVEATGVQWVDTGIIGRCGTKAEIKVEWTNLESDSAMLACRADSGNTRINFINSNWGAIGCGYGDYYAGTYNGKNSRWEKDRIYTVVTDFAASGDGATAVMTVDGYKVGDQSSESQIDTEVNLVVFGNNYGSVTGLSKARCYGLKIWQDGSLVRDFVPVSVDGRAGFRDAVSGDFFYSASGTDLIAGTLASEPDCFVEYVESSGSEYIDLEVKGKSGVKMESRMMWVAIPGDGSYVASRLGSAPRFYLMHHYGSQTIGYGDYYQSGSVATVGTIYDITTELKVGSQVSVVNGTTIYSASDSASIDTGLNLYLFGCNKDGGATYQTKARCYSLRLWEGETLVRDFRPCLKNGEACLYDQVSHRIFRTKAGTLKYGAITPKAPTSGKPDYFVTYIESRGNNYLDTGVRAKNNLRIVGDLNYTQIRTQAEELYVYLTGIPEHTLLGACASDGGNRCYAVHVNETWLWFGYGTRKGYPGPSAGYFPTTARHLYDVTMANGTQSVNVDGEELAMNLNESVAAYDIDAGCNLYLFACNKSGTVQYPARARCYSLKIWQDGVPVRDLRPCVKDGVAGFYDSVNDEIIYTAYPVAPSCVGEMDLTGESFESIKGGRKSVDGDYEVHTFTSSGTLTVEGREAVDILVVGGGGGGGSRNTSGGGGGGGGVIYKQSFAVTSGVYQVVVGVGGGGGDSARGENGGNSSIFGLVAKGGGGGGGNYPSGTTDYNGQGGGSGGGGSGANAGGSNNPGDGMSGHGNAGGKGYKWRGGGGGGYAAAGGDSVAEGQAGAGGAGFECLITGKAVCYGSGGGGGSTAKTGNGLGGDGAGNGGVYNGSVGEAGGNGVDGTGGGGGGGGGNSTNNNGYGAGGNGGSGVVIIRCKRISHGTRIVVR